MRNSNTLALFVHMHTLMSCIDDYSEDSFSLLRSKIRGLHPVHRTSLEALLRHLLNVASHSDKNRMTVKELSSQFCDCVLGYDLRSEEGNYLKARCIDVLCCFPADTPTETCYGGSYSKCANLVRRASLSATTCSFI